jgi:hypothetical protein
MRRKCEADWSCAVVVVEDVRGGVIFSLIGHVIELVLISLAPAVTPEAPAVPRHPPVEASTDMLRPLRYILHIPIAIEHVLCKRLCSTSS